MCPIQYHLFVGNGSPIESRPVSSSTDLIGSRSPLLVGGFELVGPYCRSSRPLHDPGRRNSSSVLLFPWLVPHCSVLLSVRRNQRGQTLLKFPANRISYPRELVAYCRKRGFGSNPSFSSGRWYCSPIGFCSELCRKS
jgi:hypothetical protein